MKLLFLKNNLWLFLLSLSLLVACSSDDSDDNPDPTPTPIATATCSDNTQNGDETGIDCGGSCDPCTVEPTCTDGVQNQNEEGVDCGGPCNNDCPSCNDGVQNQNEQGVDCGGPCDNACPNCSDNMQNGNETGVDCGGPLCAACPTCDDGIQNQDEEDVDCGGSCNTECPTIIEAESGELFSGTTDEDQTISTGGVVAFLNIVGNGFTLKDIPASKSFEIKYASELDGVISVYINDVDTGENIEFTNTGSWGSITGSVFFNYDIPNNAEVTIINNNGDVAMNVDYLAFYTTPSDNPANKVENCTDGIQNQDETGIDCGGSCIACIDNPTSLHVPASGKKLMIIGQDLDAVGGYIDSGEFPTPGGITTYVYGYDNTALLSETNWGAGPLNGNAVKDTYTDSAIVIGMNINENFGDLMRNIPAGEHDDELDALVAFIGSADRPVYIRIGYEFDNPGNDYSPGVQFRSAYAYIVNYIRQDVDAAKWFVSVWQATTSPISQGSEPIDYWYPGDEYVDWIGGSWFLSPVDHPNQEQNLMT